jgi:periplasmic protein TonB
MGYQALLFCPDEKLARVVSQVFGELDFTVEVVQEPFAAVKKLMAQRYDAMVVDCENEANASLLFKSARNSGSNQSSLAIAVVEGQAGVAKAYRIGANLVLTKPINVEQAKGTLRVARGLLRKNADAVGTPSPARTAAPVFAGSSFPTPNRSAETMAAPPSHSELPQFEAPLPAMKPLAFSAATPAAFPAITASANVEDKSAVVSAPAAETETQTEITIAAEPAVEAPQPSSAGVARTDLVGNDAIKNDDEAAKIAAAHVAPTNPSSAFASAPGSAAAPAPAREVTAAPVPAKTKEKEFVQFEAANPSHAAASTFRSASAIDAPSFAALGEEDSKGSGGSKKFLIAAVAVLVLAALGWKLGKFATTLAPQHVSAPQSLGQPVPVPAPLSSPVAAPSTSTSSAASTVAPKTATASLPGKLSADAGNPPVIRIAATPEPAAKKPDSPPLRVKSNAGASQGEESAPQLPSPLAVASASDSNLNGLLSASPNLPKPSLATLRISQGVSQGLVIKRAQPKYPPAALAAHVQGAVQIEATINKEGSVVNLKVLSGDPVLARAALEAVRQWRYKPYYLDGQPVEIQTQITINFKAN